MRILRSGRAAVGPLGDDVNHIHYWDEGHGANTDPGDFITWIAQMAGHKAKRKQAAGRSSKVAQGPPRTPKNAIPVSRRTFRSPPPRRRAPPRTVRARHRVLYAPTAAPSLHLHNQRLYARNLTQSSTPVINPQPIPGLTETHQRSA